MCLGVRHEHVEHRSDSVKLGIGQPRAQGRIERHRGRTQLVEEGIAFRRELHDVDPAVVGIAPPGEQSVSLHAVEMVGQGGLAEAYSISQFPLVRCGADQDVEKDEPGGQRAARGRERLIECAPDGA